MAVSLDQILSTTRATLPELSARRHTLERAAAIAPDPTTFRSRFGSGTVGLIAEVKRRSPSAGSINEALSPVERAATYAQAGAAAISVLTDQPFFGGSLDDLRAVSAALDVPTLRKDFILAEEQVLEARIAGAAAVLLIVRALTPARLAALVAFARSAGLDALVEAHTGDEVRIALDAGATIVGINSRDLDTFTIDVARAWQLFRLVPPGVLGVAESGMEQVGDIELAARAGADAVLVGSALSRSGDPMSLASSLAGVTRVGR